MSYRLNAGLELGPELGVGEQPSEPPTNFFWIARNALTTDLATVTLRKGLQKAKITESRPLVNCHAERQQETA